MWDFETDPEYQAKLDWVDEFVRDEVEPLDLVLRRPVRQERRARRCAVVRPLQQQVKDHGLWACHLEPGARRPGLRAGEAGAAQRDPRPLRLGAVGVRLPGARLRQRRDPRPLRHRGAEGTLPAAAARRRDLVVLLDDRAARRRRPDAVHDPRRARRRRVGDQRREVVLVERPLRQLLHRHGGDRPRRAARYKGMSMFIVPAETPGHRDRPQRRRRRRAVDHGTHGYVRYNDVRVPADHLLGGEGAGVRRSPRPASAAAASTTRCARSRMVRTRVRHDVRAGGVPPDPQGPAGRRCR